MARTSSIRRVAGVVFVIALLFGAARLVRACGDHLHGVEVRVHNVDAKTLHAVSVTVRGHSYDVGDLPPGFGYIEPGTHGWVRADIIETEVRAVEDHVGI